MVVVLELAIESAAERSDVKRRRRVGEAAPKVDSEDRPVGSVGERQGQTGPADGRHRHPSHCPVLGGIGPGDSSAPGAGGDTSSCIGRRPIRPRILRLWFPER